MSKQKLASYERFDPHKELPKRGAQMPLMIYIGSSKETRRTKEAVAKRFASAARRGYGRIQTQQVGDETRGGGEHSKGKGKHKGKGVHTHGHGDRWDRWEDWSATGDRWDGWDDWSRYNSWAEW